MGLGVFFFNKEKIDWSSKKLKEISEISDEEVWKYYNKREKLFYDDNYYYNLSKTNKYKCYDDIPVIIKDEVIKIWLCLYSRILL